MTRTIQSTLIVATVLLLSLSALATALAQASPATGPAPTKALSIPLYASLSAPAGWGWTPNNISNSLTITVQQGDVITFHLRSNDSMLHELVIDLDNSHTITAGDQVSPQFSSGTTAMDFVYTASRAGTFAFYCGLHGYSAQHGTLVTQGTSIGPPPPSGDNTPLIVGGVLVAVVVVAAVAFVMMRRRKPKVPPQP
jgi:heme/copper-type cytochrome/quinol oxidase subunit 2